MIEDIANADEVDPDAAAEAEEENALEAEAQYEQVCRKRQLARALPAKKLITCYSSIPLDVCRLRTIWNVA